MKKFLSSEQREKIELKILYRISHVMAHRHDVSVLLNEILDILENAMRFIRATLTLRTLDSDMFVIAASLGVSEDEKAHGQYRLGEGITGTVAKTGNPIFIPDITKSTEFLNRTKARKKQKVAFIYVPIIHHKQVIGTFRIDKEISPESELTRDMNFFKLIADLLAEAIACIRIEIEEKEAIILENKRLKLQLGENIAYLI